jgi:riboflavin biosynthesis pyrimidine reductase
MHRLHPSPAGPITVAEAYGDLRPEAALGRPWLALCMVASIDGSTALDGESRGLSSDTDRAVLLALRQLADIILVGAGTVRAEGYGVPKKPGQRIGVVTKSGNVDETLPLFTSGAGFLVLPEDAARATPIECVRAGVGTLDLGLAVRRLPGEPGFVQVEGGPTLNGALTDADLLDEVNITTSPQVVGGAGSRVASGGAPTAHRFDLAQLCIDDGFVFSRYVRRR